MTGTDSSEYLNLDEASEKYKTSKDTLRRRIKEGLLPASKPFGKVLIRIVDLEKLFKKTPVAS